MNNKLMKEEILEKITSEYEADFFTQTPAGRHFDRNKLASYLSDLEKRLEDLDARFTRMADIMMLDIPTPSIDRCEHKPEPHICDDLNRCKKCGVVLFKELFNKPDKPKEPIKDSEQFIGEWQIRNNIELSYTAFKELKDYLIKTT